MPGDALLGGQVDEDLPSGHGVEVCLPGVDHQELAAATAVGSAGGGVRNHHSQGLEKRGRREELRGLVSRELLGDPPATDDRPSPVTLIDVDPLALQRNLAGAVPAFGDWDDVPDLPAAHEAQLLLACGIREGCWEWLVGDRVPVLCCVLLEASVLILDARLLLLWLHGGRELVALSGELGDAHL